jgi:signal transduction histidine kinase
MNSVDLPETATHVLIVAPLGKDATLAGKVLNSAGIQTEIFESFESLAERLKKPSGLLLIAEEAITPFALQLISETLANQETWSDLPIILLTSENRRFNHTKKIVEHFGNVANISLLERPFSVMTLITMVKVAIRARLKQYEVQRLLHSQQKALKIRDEFLSIASHELKTPITTIRLQTQMKQRLIKKNDESIFTPVKVKEFVRVMDKQTSRISRLVDDMLDVTRIENGKLSLQTELCDLNQIVEQTVDSFVSEKEELDHLFTIDSDKELFGYWDKYRIEQVVINLLTNAVKYGNGYPVDIIVRGDSDHATLMVKDHGIGISEKDLERVFERFERAVDGGKISGLGLGLFISKQIVQMHGGELTVISSLGEGSTFTMKLPRKDVHKTK